jgi:formylglycine-generating enzyme required for sulfatase activity
VDLLGKYAWYTANSRDRFMQLPGSLKPNDLGLFDMLGNAFEWCQDGIDYYPRGAHGGPVSDNGYNRDIRSILEEPPRVLRGGAFTNRPMFVRSAYRFRLAPRDRNGNVGFRPARTFR